MSDLSSGLKIGFLSYTDPGEATRMASMPYRMARALESRVEKLVTFSPEGGTGMGRIPRPITEFPIIGRAARHFKWRYLTFDGSMRGLEHHIPKYTYRRTLRMAATVARRLADRVRRHDLDALFGCIVTWPLFRLPLDLPYVFYTDATTTMVNATFPRFSDRCWGFKQACTEIEDSVYASASAVGVPAERVLESAYADHSLAAGRGHVVPMGANVTPVEPLSGVEGLSLPSRDELRLFIVASDPARKRLDFAVEVVEALRLRGWNAILDIIGRSTARADACPSANFLGRVQLAIPGDVERMRAAYARGHLFILPSLGEGAAISPAEAAHFGRPSIVSDVAGLPTVVKDGETGRVLSLAAGPGEYVDAIEGMVSAPEAYLGYAGAALARAQRLFTWDAWGDGILALLRESTERSGDGR